MAKDIVTEAVEEAKRMKATAFESAKHQLAEAMSPTIQKVVSDQISEELGGGGDPPSDYDEDGEQKRVDDNLPAVGDSGDDLSDEGDGPAVVEASIEEDDMDYEEEDELELGDEEIEDDIEDDVIEIVEDGDEELDLDIDDGDEEIDMEAEPEIEPEIMDEPEEDEIEDVQFEAKLKEASIANRNLKKAINKRDKAITAMRNTIKEVNLFNARLAGATRLMKEVTLTKIEKDRVVERFDECETIGEVKRTFKVMKDAYRTGGKATRTKAPKKNLSSVKSALNEHNSELERMQEMAGILND